VAIFNHSISLDAAGNRNRVLQLQFLGKKDALLLNSFNEIFAEDLKMTREKMAFGICALI